MVSVSTSNDVDFFGNVIDETTGRVFSGVWNAPSFPNAGRSDCIVANVPGGLPQTGPGTLTADPVLDADYRPAGHSPVVDACSSAVWAPADSDIETTARGFDVAGVDNGPGTLDLGAFEFVGSVDVDGGEVRLFPVLVETAESAGDVVFLVDRTGATNGAIEIRADTVAGTATPDSDYTPVEPELNWADGESGQRWFAVPVLDDAVAEPAERFGIVLSVAAGNPTISGGSATVVLFDNDEGLFADGFESP